MVPQLEAVPGVVHGFFGRQGGVSVAPYASLNFNAKTEEERPFVLQNSRIAKQYLGVPNARVVLLKQIHSARVHRIPARDDLPEVAIHYAEGDACHTQSPHILLGAISADCVPVLIASADGSAVGAAHSGWRGTHAGVVPALVKDMRECYGLDYQDLRIALGPAIAGSCYQVQSDCIQHFRDVPQAFREASDGYYLDVKAVIVEQLWRMGIGADQIADIPVCNHCDADNYFSYRRDGSPVGCMAAFIGLHTSSGRIA